jgi:hypothetical protein
LEFEISNKQINAEGNPDLGQYGILRSSKKCFDLQVLFDPFEKELGLPTFFVNCGNFAGLQMMGIGDKMIFLVGVLISVGNQTQRFINVL